MAVAAVVVAAVVVAAAVVVEVVVVGRRRSNSSICSTCTTHCRTFLLVSENLINLILTISLRFT